ncbi:MAG: hypothetical protein K2H28_08920, partial [Ruminococcus sp.]|nr:hypothetical protein [Ruminococcus sp.]
MNDKEIFTRIEKLENEVQEIKSIIDMIADKLFSENINFTPVKVQTTLGKLPVKIYEEESYDPEEFDI